MFLHIGEGKIIDKEKIIGVFDLETTSTSKRTREFLRNSEKKGIVKNVSEEIPKTYIICEKNGEERVYITQISPKTLLKRAERNEEFGTEN
ncbi:MAG: DUF370 domain-containing protein [Clostridia bacterium]|nr:DUF370 domain-containing protein [Clostridia bacterium]